MNELHYLFLNNYLIGMGIGCCAKLHSSNIPKSGFRINDNIDQSVKNQIFLRFFYSYLSTLT